MLKLNHLTGFGSGVAAVPTATSYNYDGGDSYLEISDHADFDFADGNFVIDCWVRFSTLSGTQIICTHREGGSDVMQFRWRGSVNKWSFQFFTTGGGTLIDLLSGVDSLSINTWYHLAVVRSTNDWFVFRDGVEQVTVNDNPTYPNYVGDFTIGSDAFSDVFNGNMDEFRVSKGTDRGWSGGFTPSTVPYESDANTLLLIHGGEAIASGATGSGATFVDSGNTGHTVTENGNAIRDTTVYKF